ncbi:MAG: DUF4282 domain-containing protein, partial [Trebonia sp.]
MEQKTMAGQPEPSFQPSGQDQGLTQGRPAWQPAAYPPPMQDQAYAAPPPDQAYTGHEQTYTNLGQSQDYQAFGGYQPPVYAAQPGQGQGGQGQTMPPPQWQSTPPPSRTRAGVPGEKGFIGSLFDFSFSSFVTPRIIKVLYVLFTLWTALLGLIILVIGFRTGGVAGGLFTLIIVEPIFLLLTLGIYRVVLEAFMVIFRMYE